MGRVGIQEIIFIVLVIVVLFGTKKLPEIGSALGKAIREFRKAGREIGEDIKQAANQDESEKKSQ